MGTTLHVYALVFKFITLFLFFTPNNNIVFDFEHLHMQWDIHEIVHWVTGCDHQNGPFQETTMFCHFEKANEKFK
jgi:hypothetical protein